MAGLILKIKKNSILKSWIVRFIFGLDFHIVAFDPLLGAEYGGKAAADSSESDKFAAFTALGIEGFELVAFTHPGAKTALLAAYSQTAISAEVPPAASTG